MNTRVKKKNKSTGKLRWTKDEEKYLMENLPKLGVNVVSSQLRRTPSAIRTRFMRVAGIIDKSGRILVSLKEGSEVPSNVNAEYVSIAKDLMKGKTGKGRSSKAQVEQHEILNPVKAPSLAAQKASSTNAKVNNLHGLTVLSIIMSTISLLTAIAVVLKFII